MPVTCATTTASAAPAMSSTLAGGLTSGPTAVMGPQNVSDGAVSSPPRATARAPTPRTSPTAAVAAVQRGRLRPRWSETGAWLAVMCSVLAIDVPLVVVVEVAVGGRVVHARPGVGRVVEAHAVAHLHARDAVGRGPVVE